MKEKEIKKGEIIIYKSSKGPEIQVKLEQETVWLTQKQIAQLFNKGVSAVNEHLKNIYKEGELKEKSTIRKSRIVQIEGGRRIERNIDLYNLDAILSVGYRVNSKNATQFRIWATRTLKDYLIKGYVVNKKRLLAQSEKLKEVQQEIYFLQEKSKHQLLAGQEQEILNLLKDYSKTLTLLDKYDKRSILSRRGSSGKFELKYNNAITVISAVKKDLIAKKEASELFGQEYEQKFKAILGNIYQSFGGKELYPSIQKKAAHFLYFSVKDHPFVDGNKRIASFLFIYLLDRNNCLSAGS